MKAALLLFLTNYVFLPDWATLNLLELHLATVVLALTDAHRVALGGPKWPTPFEVNLTLLLTNNIFISNQAT